MNNNKAEMNLFTNKQLILKLAIVFVEPYIQFGENPWIR